MAKDRKVSKQNRYGRRKKLRLAPRPVIVVVCDDSTVAPAYFNELKKAAKLNVTINVDRAPCSKSSPAYVMKRAKRHKKELTDKKAADPEDRQSVWVLIDREGDDKRLATVDREKKKAVDSGIKVAESLPCYDLWTLLHFEDTGTYFADCKEVCVRLLRLHNKQLGGKADKKTEIDYGKLISHRAEACSRAKKHHEAGDQSWTEVYKVIEEIDSFLPADQIEKSSHG